MVILSQDFSLPHPLKVDISALYIREDQLAFRMKRIHPS